MITEPATTPIGQEAPENAAHTPLPWKFVPWHVEEGPSAVRAPAGYLVTTTASDADAAFIVKAVNAHHTLWDRIRKVEHDNEQAAARILRLEADLLECRKYIEREVDVVDGSNGKPAPNRAMQLCQMIDQTLNGPGGV